MKVMLVSSSGGHLAQLHELKPWWEKHDRLWVTFDKKDATSLLREETTVWAHHPTTRNVKNLIRNVFLAWSVVRRWRPELIVSTGAGVAFPFFLIAKLYRVKTVYLEVFDRRDTLTGRLCYPLTSLFLLQSEDQRRRYPRAQVIGPLY